VDSGEASSLPSGSLPYGGGSSLGFFNGLSPNPHPPARPAALGLRPGSCLVCPSVVKHEHRGSGFSSRLWLHPSRARGAPRSFRGHVDVAEDQSEVLCRPSIFALPFRGPSDGLDDLVSRPPAVNTNHRPAARTVLESRSDHQPLFWPCFSPPPTLLDKPGPPAPKKRDPPSSRTPPRSVSGVHEQAPPPFAALVRTKPGVGLRARGRFRAPAGGSGIGSAQTFKPRRARDSAAAPTNLALGPVLPTSSTRRAFTSLFFSPNPTESWFYHLGPDPVQDPSVGPRGRRTPEGVGWAGSAINRGAPPSSPHRAAPAALR